MKNLTQLSPIARVSEISEVRQDKNDRDYKILRVQGMTETKEVHGGVEISVKTPGRSVSFNQYAESYLNNEKEPFYDVSVGDYVAVEIWQAHGLKPYEITDTSTGETRDVTSYTFAVIRGQNPETVLKNSGRSFANEEIQSNVEVEEDVEMPDMVQ